MFGDLFPVDNLAIFFLPRVFGDSFLFPMDNLAIIFLLPFPVRRVKPHFTIPPSPEYEVMVGASLNLTCVAVGSPMPHVKWQRGRGRVDVGVGGARAGQPPSAPPIGKNVLELRGIRESENYTCVAASKLGIIEAHTHVRVQGDHEIFVLFYL